MIIKIKRQKSPETESYYQQFEYEGWGRDTVSHILEELNGREQLVDIQGEPAEKIRWECSCMQQICGGCAMVINGRPALACGEFIDIDNTQELVLEPLSKFPVKCDLAVDRSCIEEHQRMAMVYLGERTSPVKKEHEQQYEAAKCAKCGLCLEVCPNYTGPDGNFYGALFANDAYLMHSSTEDRKKEIAREYKLHFGRGCSKSMSCREICPMNIQTLSSIGYMNRK